MKTDRQRIAGLEAEIEVLWGEVLAISKYTKGVTPCAKCVFRESRICRRCADNPKRTRKSLAGKPRKELK
jgi:hypothetical protein